MDGSVIGERDAFEVYRHALIHAESRPDPFVKRGSLWVPPKRKVVRYDDSLIPWEDVWPGLLPWFFAITTVQETTKAIADAASSVSKAFSSNVTSGNLVTVQCWRYDNGTDTAFIAGDCTKSAGTATLGAIALDKQANVNSTNPCQAGVWSAIVTGTGSLTMAVAAAAGSYLGMTAGEYAGSWDAGRLEASNSSTATSATSPGVTGNGAAAGEGLFIACIAADASGDNDILLTANNSFTNLDKEVDATSHQPGAGARRIATATTTQGSWTIDTSGLNGWAAALAVYKEAGGGGGFTAVQRRTSGARVGSRA